MPSPRFKILVSGTAPVLYPTDTFFGLLYFEADDALEIPKKYPYQGEWGQPISTHLLEREEYPVPGMIDMVWISIVERKFYSLVEKLPKKDLEELFGQTDEDSGEALYEHIVVGMAPYGDVALWTHGFKKSTLVTWMHGEETQLDMKDFMPLNPNVTLDENCDFYINNDSRVKGNLQQNGLPSRDLFDNYMKQFTYRYLPLFEHWDEDEEKWQAYTEEEQETKPELDYIEEALYDGTHDKLHDGGLFNYHEAGKPKKLAVKWHIKKSEYTAYFWFEDEAIRTVFDKFYGIHPDTKTDFVIHIDPEKTKYELALYRYGMNEPKPISEDAYQLIVFKNKFEHFRNDNYDQPRGAWIW
jgi:hypothetical protein